MISRTSEIPDLNKYALIRWKMTALFIYNKGPQTLSVLSACCDFQKKMFASYVFKDKN